MSRKRFTVSEANSLIPTLEGVLAQVEHRIESVQRAAERLQVLDLLWGEKVLDESNPDYGEGQEFRLLIARLMGEVETLVEEEILGRGLRFPQGGLENGLIDFPTSWEGRWVYLCWRRGEPAIEAWHETDAGFAGRQELTEEQERQMGVEEIPGWLDSGQ